MSTKPIEDKRTYIGPIKRHGTAGLMLKAKVKARTWHGIAAHSSGPENCIQVVVLQTLNNV